jgi:hypothetical protein
MLMSFYVHAAGFENTEVTLLFDDGKQLTVEQMRSVKHKENVFRVEYDKERLNVKHSSTDKIEILSCTSYSPCKQGNYTLCYNRDNYCSYYKARLHTKKGQVFEVKIDGLSLVLEVMSTNPITGEGRRVTYYPFLHNKVKKGQRGLKEISFN